MSTPKPISAAAARRARMELLAERQRPATPLPAEFLTWLASGYRPLPALAGTWSTQLRPFVEQSLAQSGIRGPESLRQHVTHVAYLGQWALLQGIELSPETVLRRPVVDEYCRVGMTGSTLKSQSDRRSRLRRLADSVHPDQAPAPSVSIARPSIKPPYNDAEMADVRRVCGIQPTPELARQLSTCVGLGAGAGIDSPDLRQLRRSHVTDHGEDGICVQVPGDRARTVWVLREYEQTVRRGLTGLAPTSLLIGRIEDRRNVAGDVYNRAILVGNLPALEQGRLRTTWLVTLMSRPVPLRVILTAAGLKSTRTLFDLLSHIPVNVDEARTLRDGGVA